VFLAGDRDVVAVCHSLPIQTRTFTPNANLGGCDEGQVRNSIDRCSIGRANCRKLCRNRLERVDEVLNKAAVVSGDVHRYGLPRSDLHVTLDGVTIKPALALGGWIAFAPMHGEAMVMGDLVLLETESPR